MKKEEIKAKVNEKLTKAKEWAEDNEYCVWILSFAAVGVAYYIAGEVHAEKRFAMGLMAANEAGAIQVISPDSEKVLNLNTKGILKLLRYFEKEVTRR